MKVLIAMLAIVVGLITILPSGCGHEKPEEEHGTYTEQSVSGGEEDVQE